MLKHVYVFQAELNPIEADRYYFRFHSKEVVRFFGPWLRRYETFRALDAPPEADRFGVRRGRLTELWYNSVAEFREARPVSRPYTPPPGGWGAFFGRTGAATTIVPAAPTEDFLLKEPTPEERPILRWYQVFKYPDGVSAAEGDAWYLRHAEEVKSQPGLTHFVSHRALDEPPVPSPWRRVSELWYDDFAAWRAAIAGAADYTPPPWGGTYPFVDMVSTFVGYKPDVDFLKDNPAIP